MGFIRWIFAIVVLSAWLALIGTALYVAMYSEDGVQPEGDVIVVLAGNAAKNSSLNGQTGLRLEKAVALYEAGVAPKIVVTGGGEPPVAVAMRDAAIEAGVPEVRVSVPLAFGLDDALKCNSTVAFAPQRSVSSYTWRISRV